MSARAQVKVTEVILGAPRLPTRMSPGHTQPQLQLIKRFTWVKRPGRDVDYTRSSSVKDKKGRSYRDTPTIRLHAVDKKIFTFLCQ